MSLAYWADDAVFFVDEAVAWSADETGGVVYAAGAGALAASSPGAARAFISADIPGTVGALTFDAPGALVRVVRDVRLDADVHPLGLSAPEGAVSVSGRVAPPVQAMALAEPLARVRTEENAAFGAAIQSLGLSAPGAAASVSSDVGVAAGTLVAVESGVSVLISASAPVAVQSLLLVGHAAAAHLEGEVVFGAGSQTLRLSAPSGAWARTSALVPAKTGTVALTGTEAETFLFVLTGAESATLRLSGREASPVVHCAVSCGTGTAVFGQGAFLVRSVNPGDVTIAVARAGISLHDLAAGCALYEIRERLLLPSRVCEELRLGSRMSPSMVRRSFVNAQTG